MRPYSLSLFHFLHRKSVVSPGTVEISVVLTDEQKKFTAVKSTKKAAKLEAAKMALQYVKSNAR